MPKARKSDSRHGFHRLVVAIKTKDLRALDRRCAGAKALMQWKNELVSALGGADAISPQKAVLVDAIVRGKLFIDNIDVFLLEQKSLVNRRSKKAIPLLAQRQTLVDGLLRLLTAIGLDRIAKNSGGIPESWITKVLPAEEQEQVQEPGEKSGGHE
jgi:hypothetical protein